MLASTSGRTGPAREAAARRCAASHWPPAPARPRPPSRRPAAARRPLPVPRVTNTGAELGEAGDATTLDLGIQYQVPNPEDGPLERRVGTLYLEALFSDEVSDADAAYWFCEPPGGWPTEPKRVRAAVRVAPEAVTAVRPAGAVGEAPRTPLLEVRVGDTLTGPIAAATFTAGILVDVGAAYDGLLPVASDTAAWKAVGGLRVGQEVAVRVAKVLYSPVARFPILLELVAPAELAGAFLDPEAETGAFDLRGVGGETDGLDALTGGAWSGGAPAEVTIVPSGKRSREDVVGDEGAALAASVAAWVSEAQPPPPPPAPTPTPAPAASSDSDGEGGGGEEEEAARAWGGGWGTPAGADELGLGGVEGSVW